MLETLGRMSVYRVPIFTSVGSKMSVVDDAELTAGACVIWRPSGETAQRILGEAFFKGKSEIYRDAGWPVRKFKWR